MNSVWAEMRIYSDTIPAIRIGGILGLDPSDTAIKDEKTSPVHRGFPKHGWFLSSDEHSLSKDARSHLDFVLDRFLAVEDRYRTLQETGDVEVSACMFWWASRGSAPVIGAEQARKLALLGLDLHIQFQEMDPEVSGTRKHDA